MNFDQEEKVMRRVDIPIAEDIVTLVTEFTKNKQDFENYTITELIEFAVASFIDDFEFNQAELLSMPLEAFTEDVEGTEGPDVEERGSDNGIQRNFNA